MPHRDLYIVIVESLYVCLCFSVHVVLKARVLKWFTIPFSGGPYFVRGPHFLSNYQQILMHHSLFSCFSIVSLLKTLKIISLCSSSLHSLCLQSDATSEIHEQCCNSANLDRTFPPKLILQSCHSHGLSKCSCLRRLCLLSAILSQLS